MQKSDNINELAAALVLAQPTFENAAKDSVNPFFKSKYADLGAVWAAVQDGLSKHDLTVSQFPDHIDGAPALTTILIHMSGQWLSATYPLVVAKPGPQEFGSAISYARRYGLSAVLGVIADDDDGEAAQRPAKAQNRPDAPASEPSGTGQPSAKPAASSPPKVTPQEWAAQQITAIREFSTKVGLDAWENRTAGAMTKLRASNPDLHRDILDNLKARREGVTG